MPQSRSKYNGELSRTCISCKQELPIDCFTRWLAGSSNVEFVNGTCRECSIENRRKYNGTSSNQLECRKEAKARYRQKKSKAYVKAYCRNNWWRSGVVFESEEEFEYWFERYYTADACEATRLYFDESSKMLCKCLDHDHKTGKPRGVICGLANLTLGKVEEDPELLRDLANYLEKHHG